jgi:hypothetical protein
VLKSGGLFGLGSANPMDTKVEWMWQDLNQTKNQIMRSDVVTFNSTGTHEKTTDYQSSVGTVLANYYYLRISWSDEKGSHSVESAKAYCK